jgi:hypothetical protein
VVDWLEKLDEFLESNLEPPSELVNAMGQPPAQANPHSS